MREAIDSVRPVDPEDPEDLVVPVGPVGSDLKAPVDPGLRDSVDSVYSGADLEMEMRPPEL